MCLLDIQILCIFAEKDRLVERQEDRQTESKVERQEDRQTEREKRPTLASKFPLQGIMQRVELKNQIVINIRSSLESRVSCHVALVPCTSKSSRACHLPAWCAQNVNLIGQN